MKSKWDNPTMQYLLCHLDERALSTTIVKEEGIVDKSFHDADELRPNVVTPKQDTSKRYLYFVFVLSTLTSVILA